MTDEPRVPDSTDDGPTPRALAVSAYVDGEASEEEIALVESDPELLAEVDRLRSLAQRLSAITPLPDSQRKRLVGVALDAFDQRGDGGDDDRLAGVAPPPPPASRRGSSRWLAAAAAVVALAATAGIAVALVAGDGSDDADSDEVSREQDVGPLSSTAAPGARPASTMALDDERAGDSSATAPVDAPAEATVDAGETASSRTEPDRSVAPATAAAGTSRTGSGRAVEIVDARSLVDWVVDVEDGTFAAPTVADAKERRCGSGERLGVARHRGDDVVVVREDERVVAYDADTCAAVLSADAP